MSYFTSVDALESGAAERDRHPEEVAELRRRIAAELQGSFSRFLYEEHGQRAEADPVLSTIFLGVSDQLASVYEAIGETLPLAVIDELMSGLALPMRCAQPGQAVVQFENVEQRERLTRDRQIVAQRSGGRELLFSLDRPLRVAPATLVFAAVYEPSPSQSAGRLVTVAGAEPRPGIPLLLETRPLALSGTAPTLYLAIQTDDQNYDLGGLGIFIDVTNARLSRAVRRSPWNLLAPDDASTASDVVPEHGVLRPASPRNAGPTQLVWASPPTSRDDDRRADPAATWPTFDGQYDSSIWLLPSMPTDRRFVSRPPAAIADAARDMLPEEHRDVLDTPCTWIQIPIDPNVRGVADGIRRVGINCMTASNAYPWGAEQIVFAERGTVMSTEVTPAGERHVLGVLRVNGSAGDDYLPLSAALDRADVGRFRVRMPLVEFFPRRDGDRVDRHVAVELFLTDGAATADQNGLMFVRVDRHGVNELLNVKSLTPVLGGSAPPSVTAARARFARQIRARDRVVTPADVDATVRAFDARVTAVRVDPPVADNDGMTVRRVERVSVRLSGKCTPDEVRALERQITDELQQCAMIGLSFRVRVTADG